LFLFFFDNLAVVFFCFFLRGGGWHCRINTIYVHCQKIQNAFTPVAKQDRKGSKRFSFILVSKGHTNKLYNFWQCTYMYMLSGCVLIDFENISLPSKNMKFVGEWVKRTSNKLHILPSRLIFFSINHIYIQMTYLSFLNQT
jgi:hypothetical protein